MPRLPTTTAAKQSMALKVIKFQRLPQTLYNGMKRGSHHASHHTIKSGVPVK